MGEGIGKILKPAFEISRILGNIKTWIEDLKFLNLKGGVLILSARYSLIVSLQWGPGKSRPGRFPSWPFLRKSGIFEVFRGFSAPNVV